MINMIEKEKWKDVIESLEIARLKPFKPTVPDQFKTCEYCIHYKGTHCSKHIKRNRVFERCSHFEFDESRR